MSEVIIYQSVDNQTEVEVKFDKLSKTEIFIEELREFYRSRVNPALIKV